MGIRADEIVLVPNATFGMNMVARSLSLAEGDRVVTTGQTKLTDGAAVRVRGETEKEARP